MTRHELATTAFAKGYDGLWIRKHLERRRKMSQWTDAQLELLAKMRRRYGMSWREIAECLDTTQTAAQSQYYAMGKEEEAE